MNKVILIGNLTRDPEVNTTQNGVKFARFSIAVKRRFANSDGEQEVDFFNIVAWRGLAENCGKYLFKGSKVAVGGAIQLRTYEDSGGIKRTATDIVADDIQFLTPKNSSADSTRNEQNKSTLEPIDDEDLPF